MDPATLAFLITGVASLLGFAAAGAARDVAHIAKGREGPLPSEQAAAKRRERRERLGKKLDPDEKPPGYLRRLLTNAHEERRAKAGGARRADREWLDKNRDQLDADGYEKEKAKRERKAANKASRTRMLDAFLGAPKGQRLKAALASRKADTTKPDKEVIDEQDTADENAKVLPFRQRHADDKPADDSRTRMLIADMPDEVVRQLAGRDGDERQAEAQRVLDERERTGTTVAADPDQTWRIHPDGRIERISHTGDLDPNAITRGYAGGRIDDPTDDMCNTDAAPAPTNTQEDNPMSTIPEITNVSGAVSMATQMANLGGKVAATADSSKGSFETAKGELEQAKSALENGASNLRADDLEAAAATVDQMHEAAEGMRVEYEAIVTALDRLQAQADAFGSANSSFSQILERQQPLAEQVNAADQGNLAKRTDYYQYS